jgi:hypothetical protein
VTTARIHGTTAVTRTHYLEKRSTGLGEETQALEGKALAVVALQTTSSTVDSTPPSHTRRHAARTHAYTHSRCTPWTTSGPAPSTSQRLLARFEMPAGNDNSHDAGAARRARAHDAARAAQTHPQRAQRCIRRRAVRKVHDLRRVQLNGLRARGSGLRDATVTAACSDATAPCRPARASPSSSAPRRHGSRRS